MRGRAEVNPLVPTRHAERIAAVATAVNAAHAASKTVLRDVSGTMSIGVPLASTKWVADNKPKHKHKHAVLDLRYG